MLQLEHRPIISFYNNVLMHSLTLQVPLACINCGYVSAKSGIPISRNARSLLSNSMGTAGSSQKVVHEGCASVFRVSQDIKII